MRTTPERHPATALVWDWLENGDGKDKPAPIRRAARERIEQIDREFLAWDAEQEAQRA